MANMSTEISIGILRRLPAKSLLRFRCVSKEWSSLYSEPYLEKLRLQDHLNWKLIARDGLLYSLDLDSFDCAFRDDHLLQDSNFTVKKVLGLSNGKLCLSVSDNNANPDSKYDDYRALVRDFPPVELNNDTIVICDLSTGARRIVPPSPVDFRVESFDDVPLRTMPEEWAKRFNIRILPEEIRPIRSKWMWRHFSYGFGFDPSSDDYKLVRISQYIFTVSSQYIHYMVSEAKVYSMKTDSWSRVDQDTSRFYINHLMEPVLVDGVLYWVAGSFYTNLKNWESCRELVVAFDLAKESFWGIAHEEEFDWMCLGSMGGKLCALGCASGMVKLWKVEDRGDVWTLWACLTSMLCWPHLPSLYREAMTFSKSGDKVLVDNICFDVPKERETAGMYTPQVIILMPPREGREGFRREKIFRMSLRKLSEFGARMRR